MSVHEDPSPVPVRIAEQNVSLAKNIARRLRRRYGWVSIDDLNSYAYLGLTLATKVYDSSRGVPFERFACRKAMYLAIDQMRKDGILRRADSTCRRREAAGSELELPDPAADRARELLEAREFCSELFKRLNEQGRKLLTMIYAEKLTYKEIAKVLDISESAVCLRHKAVILKLRRQTVVRQLAA